MSSNLNLDYYYGTEAEQFSFYRIPKTLLTDPRYKNMSISWPAQEKPSILFGRVFLPF